jgi:uncharacterized protein (UPF0332 family)
MNYLEQAKKELARADKSLRAARILLENQLYEDCVSRSYYAVLHAAKAALIKIGVEAESHQAVRRMFGLHLVKTEQIEKHFAEILTAQQEDREIGDYNIYLNIQQDRAAKRVLDAEKFVQRIEKYLGSSPEKPKKA